MIRIVIVDDQKSIRVLIQSSLVNQPNLEIVGTVDDGYSAIEQV